MLGELDVKTNRTGNVGLMTMYYSEITIFRKLKGKICRFFQYFTKFKAHFKRMFIFLLVVIATIL